MSSKDKCWVEFTRASLRAIRIFKTWKAAIASGKIDIVEMSRAIATAQIRRQVFERDNFTCVKCGIAVSWTHGEMDEIKSKGRGGEVSVSNAQTLCHACHTAKHGRFPRFGEKVKV